MNSNASENMFSPRKNEINEANLNFLNEEASQFIEENDNIKYKMNKYSPYNDKYENFGVFNENQGYYENKDKFFHTFSKKDNNNLYIDNDYNSDENNEDDVKYLRYKNVELNRELKDKLAKIEALNEQIKNKDILIQTYKKTISGMQDKLSSTDKIKQHINFQNRQIFETESETNVLKAEYMKLQETLNNKDHLIDEFQKLTEVSKNKFKFFENTNQKLNSEIESLNQEIADLKIKLADYSQRDIEKDNTIQELKNSRNTYDKLLEESKYELLKKEEKLRIKFDEKEKELKHKLKEKEDHLKEEYLQEIKGLTKKMDEIKSQNDKLKFENIDLKALMDDFENNKHEREIEFKREMILKENDNEKLQKKLKELQNEIEDLERKISDKSNDFNSRIRTSEQNEGKFIYQINLKEKKIKELEEEIEILKNLVVDLQGACRENELKLENKQKIINQLKLTLEENAQEVKNLESEIGLLQQNNMRELEQITIKISDLSQERENLVLENEDLKSALLKATNRIGELNEIIELKYQGIENQLIKEKASKENIERRCKELQKKFNSNNEKLCSENNELKRVLEQKQIEIENILTKYETKIQKLKLKLNEQEYSKDQIIGDMSSMKDWASSLDKRFDPQLNYSSSSLYNVNRYEDPVKGVDYENKRKLPNYKNIAMQEEAHKNMLENFKDIIDKIDDKIYGQYQKTISDKSYNQTDISIKNVNV